MTGSLLTFGSVMFFRSLGYEFLALDKRVVSS